MEVAPFSQNPRPTEIVPFSGPNNGYLFIERDRWCSTKSMQIRMECDYQAEQGLPDDVETLLDGDEQHDGAHSSDRSTLPPPS
jgi:hypothetical protein